MTDAWEVDPAYEAYIGRWSRLVAPRFLRWLAPGPGGAWCDVGCGTGALAHTVLRAADPATVVGVEPSERFAAAALAATDDPRLDVRPGTAESIPAADSEFDRVVSGLVLNFVPHPVEGLAEMRRVTRAGGTVAGYVWDYADGMQMIRVFWDAARALDAAAADLDEGVRFPLCRPQPLRDALSTAGLGLVEVHPLDIRTVFTDFDDFWRPFLGGQGPAPGYCLALPAGRRAELRDLLDARLRRDESGRIALTARAWAFRGTVSR
ncbi:class I SAM-dependent methyltransferase [Rhodococcus sp. NPDC056960]|uniref:class I SAM-dependent methyltransferase n=1 Tax=Rhodococcus sp. NPDC056960 TaxID=3345982 RepID=UPI00362C5FAD